MSADKSNVKRGEVALPEAGEGAFLKFDVNALEKLEDQFGEGYLDILLRGMTQARPKIFKALIVAGIQNSNNIDMPWGLTFEELQKRILDAIYSTIHGRTFEEQQKHEDEIFKKRLAEAETNPRMAAALFSQSSRKPDTEPA